MVIAIKRDAIKLQETGRFSPAVLLCVVFLDRDGFPKDADPRPLNELSRELNFVRMGRK